MKVQTFYGVKKARMITKTVLKKGLNEGIALLTACHTKFQQGQIRKGDTPRGYNCMWNVMTHPL